MASSVVASLFIISCIFIFSASGICFRERDACEPMSNTPIGPFRVISQEELRKRQCCARQSIKDRDQVVFAGPAFVATSTARETPLVPQVFNPYATASLIAIAGNRVMLSATGSWDYLTGRQVPEGVERVNYAYANMFKLGRAVGVAQEDLVQLSILAKGTDSPLFNDFRTRANNITLAEYGQTSATYPGRDFIGVLASEGANSAVSADSSLNSFATVAEFSLACEGVRRWNLPCNITQTIATIVTQTPEADDFLTNRIRAFLPNTTNGQTCTWYQPPPDQRPAVAFDNIMSAEGVYLNTRVPGLEGRVTPSRVARIEIWTLNYSQSFDTVVSKIQQYFGPGQSPQYPTLRYQQVANLAQQDVYEMGLRYYVGAFPLQAQRTLPFPPVNGLPYSNAIRAGDYVYTSLFGGHVVQANGSLGLVPVAERVEQAYRNMLAAAAAFQAYPQDLFHVEATSTDLLRDQPLVDAASRLLFGAEGPFPTRFMQQQPAVLFGETFEVSGVFYAPRCRSWND